MSQYIIKDSQVLQTGVTINGDGSNTYNNWTWTALANTTWSPAKEFVSESGQPSVIIAYCNGTNASTTVIELQVSLDGNVWFALTGSPITLTGASAAITTPITVNATWNWIRARSTTVSASTTFSVEFRV